MGSVEIETYNNNDIKNIGNKIIVKVNDVFLHKIVTVDNNVSKNEGGSETNKRSYKRHMVISKDKLDKGSLLVNH